jgi:hypothetical protein
VVEKCSVTHLEFTLFLGERDLRPERVAQLLQRQLRLLVLVQLESI